MIHESVGGQHKITRHDLPPDVKELDECGKGEWELVQVVHEGHVMSCYWKRPAVQKPLTLRLMRDDLRKAIAAEAPGELRDRYSLWLLRIEDLADAETEGER